MNERIGVDTICEKCDLHTQIIEGRHKYCKHSIYACKGCDTKLCDKCIDDLDYTMKGDPVCSVCGSTKWLEVNVV